VDAVPAGAVSAAVENTVRFHTVANHTATTMSTFWRNSVNGTFKTIEDMGLTAQTHFNTLIILITANLAHVHFSAYKDVRERLLFSFHGIIDFLHGYLLFQRAACAFLIFARRARI
jgi:hypothetical protein